MFSSEESGGEEVSDDMRPVCLQTLCFRGLLTSQDSLYELDHKERKNKTKSATLQTLSRLPEPTLAGAKPTDFPLNLALTVMETFLNFHFSWHLQGWNSSEIFMIS